jgi:hypothetical protein
MDYDSAGGKKKFCIYIYTISNNKKEKKSFNSANAGPKPG